MKITVNKIIKINKKFRGYLRSDSSLNFAESHCRNIRSKYKCAAIWIRAIIIYHPFTDANKRTALYVTRTFIKVNDKEKLTKTLIRIAKKNIINIEKIIEMLENANR